MTTTGQTSSTPAIPTLCVRTPDGTMHRFSQSFHIGREHDCEVRIQDSHVSRRHVRVSFEDGCWLFRDLQSANGIFVNGQRVQVAPIDASKTITLGVDGPAVTLEIEGARPKSSSTPLPETVQSPVRETVLLADYAERYFGSGANQGPVGGRTQMIRKAFEKVQKKQTRKYRSIVAVVVLAALGTAGYAYHVREKGRRQLAMAEELFYAMKALDVDIAGMERELAASGSSQTRERAKRYQARRRQLEAEYDTFVSGLDGYRRPMTEEDRLILRVTRLFGECELAAPPDYLSEVMVYIRKWQSSGRFERAVKLAQERGYTKPITEALIGQNLPPQYFYLAMQESDFDPYISGPPTRWGIAKGMWQFIPETGARYGLTIGPLAGSRAPDPADDRQKWQKATQAAALYIKDIYATDAQASGLLVMASYNWGEQRIIDLLKTMPENPQERNFWKVLEKHRNRVPKQTYDYVFYIVAAAVIGENPR
ncbi:MAG: FHA domain-containing protein, partial [Vicinamibacterales bacterium]